MFTTLQKIVPEMIISVILVQNTSQLFRLYRVRQYLNSVPPHLSTCHIPTDLTKERWGKKAMSPINYLAVTKAVEEEEDSTVKY